VQGVLAIKEKKCILRDLNQKNIVLNFKELKKDNCVTKSQSLANYIQSFDFADKHGDVDFKIADLGFSRRLEFDDLA